MRSVSVDVSQEINEAFFTTLGVLAGRDTRVRKRLTEIVIELLQNVRKHGCSVTGASLTVVKEVSHIQIRSRNTLRSSHVAVLARTIRTINALDRASLRSAHLKHLASRSCRGTGAGLGLFRIAMRASSPLYAQFKKMDSHRHALHLTVNLATRP